MELKEKDFIEIEFTGRIKDGEVFDSNIKEDLKKANSDVEAKPFIFCLGENMFLKTIDEFLVGKPDTPASYEIELSPEKAFGKRNSELIQMVSLKMFQQHKITPFPGTMFNFDGRIAKILTLSGGRVLVDFNNPLAGKTLVYKIRVLRKIEDLNEKIRAFIEFLFKKDLKFEIKDKKLLIQVEKPMMDFVEIFKDKFKDIFNLELEVQEAKESEVKEIDDKNEKKKEKKLSHSYS